MGNKKLQNRDEVSADFKWHIHKMYQNNKEWDRDLETAQELAEDFNKFRGHLGDSALMLADALEMSDRIELLLEKAFVYSRMKLDEDNRVSKQQAMYDKAQSYIAKIYAVLSFVTPEITALSEETLLSFLNEEPRLKVYEHLIKDIIRKKEHVLSADQENLMAQMSEVLGASDTVFTMLNDADMDLGNVNDEDGVETTLTHGNYISFMRSQNRQVRKEAYNCCYTAYKKLINTLASNYSNNVKTDVITSRIRKYPSSRNAALSGGNIPESVYDNLIAEVRDTLPVMHEYVALRKKILGLDELKMHDVYVPLVKLPEKKITFSEAVDLSVEGLAPLGNEYLTQFKNGIQSGWIDRYENRGKTSGAYSFGSYDSDPFILMNYDNRLEDVFTLVHEMGHSMNSFYTRSNQPFVYGGHSIFTAEVASTVNESLLMRHLLATENDEDTHKYILNMYIEAFRTTLFRQTMFAEFEKLTHSHVENGGAITADWLNQTYDELNTAYFGPALAHDDLIQYEWARIPHFYRSFGNLEVLAQKFLGQHLAQLAARMIGDRADPVDLLASPAGSNQYVHSLILQEKWNLVKC